MTDQPPTQWTIDDDLRDKVRGELVAWDSEGDAPDWPYLEDLCDLIVSLIVAERDALARCLHMWQAGFRPENGMWVNRYSRTRQETMTAAEVGALAHSGMEAGAVTRAEDTP